MICNLRFAALALLLALGMSFRAFAQSADASSLQLLQPRTVTLVVADLPKEVAWYETVLGFHDTHQFDRGKPDPDNRVIRIALGNFRLDLVWHRGSTRPPPPALYQEGYSHISFETTAIDTSYAWLTAHGIAIDAVRDRTTQALRILRFHDPEGNEIHIELPN